MSNNKTLWGVQVVFGLYFIFVGISHFIVPDYISKELATSRNLHAGTIVRELGRHIQGGGGGQPFFATAGGKDPAGISEALAASRAIVEGSSR